MSCGKLTGNFTRNILITTNDPNHPRETLVCKGQILEPLTIKPKYVNFGRTSSEAPSQKTVSITRGDGGPLNPKLVPVDTPGLEAQMNEIEAGERYELVLTLTPPFAAARIQTAVQLETGIPESPTATIPVRAVIGPGVREKPPRS